MSIGNRIKRVAREARDIPTAWGTSVSAQYDARGGNPDDKMLAKKNLNRSSKNWDRQLKELAQSVLSGREGTRSDEINEYLKYKKGSKK
jgi:hypothetical protein